MFRNIINVVMALLMVVVNVGVAMFMFGFWRYLPVWSIVMMLAYICITSAWAHQYLFYSTED